MTLPRFSFTARARPFLELGVGDSRVPGNAARWDVQRWDQPDAVWSGVEPTWQDVTCQAFEVRVALGRERTTDRFTVGTMSVTAANVSGWADLNPPDAGDINTLMLRPGRSIRFGVEHVTHGRIVLFRGFVDVVSPVYEPGSDTVRLECIDALGEVGRVSLEAEHDASHGGENLVARLDRTLDAARWPDSKRVLDATSLTLLPTELGGQVADLLGRAADSAGGAILADLDAAITYRAMDWQVWQEDRPPDATIGNVGPDDVCPVRWERPFDRADMANRIVLANTREPDPDRVTLDDLDSWGLYGVEPFERTDLETEDPAVLVELAGRYLETRGPDTIPRVRSVSLDGRTGDDVVDVLARSSCYRPARYRCRLALARGLVFDEQHLCTGVSHEITPDGWVADLNLDLGAPHAAVSAPRWEPAVGEDAGRYRWDRVAWNG